MTATEDPKNNQLVQLETDKCLSESITWEILRQYHAKQGVSAFEVVPYKITNSCLFVSMMTDLLIASMADHEDIIDANHVQHILEIGAGSGCFGFRLMSQINRKKKWFSSFRDLKLVYKMTDFAMSNVESWLKNPVIAPFVEAGVMELDTLNIITELKKKVRRTDNPLIVIANYVLDDLQHDGFCVENGRVYETLYSTHYSCSAEDPEQQPKPGNLSWTVSKTEINEDRFEDASIYELLKTYEDKGGFSFALPVGAFRVIDQLRELTDENFVLIGADWGSTEVSSKNYIVPSIHGGLTGSLSVSVNFDALKKFVELKGGTCEIAEILDLKIFVISMVKKATRQDHVRFELHERIANDNPSAMFSFLCETINASPDNFPILKVFARSLKHSRYDPEILLQFVDRYFDQLMMMIEKLNEADTLIINEVFARVLRNVYPISGVSLKFEITDDPAANLINIWKVARTANFARESRNMIARNAYQNTKEETNV